MKWDKDKEHRLYWLLEEKFKHPFGTVPDSFLNEFNIQFVDRKIVWVNGHGIRETKKPKPPKNCVIVEMSKQLTDAHAVWHEAFSIPKEVAEKFLVLGVP